MNRIDVTPLEIRDYAISLGWVLVREALKDGLFVLNSPRKDYKQLIFPIEYESRDFNSMGELAIMKLAEYHNKPFLYVLEDIREVNEDVISLRYYSENKIVNSLSFQETIESVEATKQMILAAGSSVVNPVLYHKRLSRTEATDLLKQTRFRHTQEGSFILRISCPIHLESQPNPLLFDEGGVIKPISRRAFELISNASNEIITAVEQDSFDELLESQTQSESPIISYNFCDSLVNLFDDERELPFELRFNWSRSYASKLPTPQSPSIVRFPYSFKSKVDELKNYFAPQDKEATDTFIGTVESLNGNEGSDGRRSGEVILALLIDSSIVNARVNLNAENYDIAYTVHGIGGGFVKVKGRLLPGKRVRVLDDVSVFEAVEK
ncbi:MAG TPA: hypothetical protein VIN11_00210 [Roseivirga sp.]